MLLVFIMMLIATFLFYIIDNNFIKSISDIGDYGSLLSGLFTFCGSLLLVYTLSEQRKQNEKQSIENHFYKMLEIARDNSESMKSKDKTGRDVFKQICDDVDVIYRIIDSYCNSYNGNERHPSKLEQIAISWLIVFYGLSEKTLPVLLKEVTKISALIANEQCFHIIELRKLCGYKEKCWIRFDGYQSTLAHYYRHLYQIVTYINEKSILSYDEKYHYIKTLRSQLNVFELMLLFYNTLSPYGRTWELSLCDSNLICNVDRYIAEMKKSMNKQLITKYQFFRNVTMPLLGGRIKISDFYPMINYENANEFGCGVTKDERDKLDAIYRKQNK